MKRNLNGESFSVHSNSRGNLLKTEYSDGGVMHFVKTGRIQVRDFPGYWGIEPVVEVICSRLGAKMGLDMASQCLDVLDVVRYGKRITTLISDSPDFREGRTMVYLQTLYVQNDEYIDLEHLCRYVGGEDLINMLAFDLVVMNEDRHNGNVAWLQDDDGAMRLAPIYDNGCSLLYDDIKGMMRDYKRAASFYLCNSPLYQEGFSSAERLFARMSEIYEPTIGLDVKKDVVSGILSEVKAEYEKLRIGVNNIILPDEWWDAAADFICWRMDHVRALRYNMEG